MHFLQLSRLLIGGAIIAALGLGSTLLTTPQTDMRIEPQRGSYVVGETFTTSVVVSSETPTNVFKGVVHFDPSILVIEAIDYNTSIADLWAERPWYENGEGTLNFIGGTTRRGGFIGTGELITITFHAIQEGEANISIDSVRILQHDGLGTDTTVAVPIDAIFTVEESVIEQQTVLQKSVVGSALRVVHERPSTDLNEDNKQSIVDVSIFMKDLATQNQRSDFNQDGKVNTADLSIILDSE